MLNRQSAYCAGLALSIGWIQGAASAGTLTTLHAFTEGSDGAYPKNNITHANGLLYGTTDLGGLGKCKKYGCGTIFSIDPVTGTETVLYNFTRAQDGTSSTLLAKGPDFYGTTNDYGRSIISSTFDFNLPSLSLTTLHKFNRNPTSYPEGDLVISKDRIYGATLDGGLDQHGMLYSIDLKKPKFRILHSFQNGHSDGGSPQRGVALINGSLIGTTYSGGRSKDGTVFKYDLATSAYTILHAFSGSDGAVPSSPIVSDGSTLYGTTAGLNGIPGTVYKLDLNTGQFNTLYTFGGETEGSPGGSIALDGHFIYGATALGGASSKGTIFEVDVTSGQETLLYTFTGGKDGGYLGGGLLHRDGAFYGVTYSGGFVSRACQQGCGTVFKFVP